MRWAVFLVAGVAAVVLDVSFLDGLAPDDAREIRPSITAVLAVFVTLCGPRTPALWACFILGLALDLSLPVASPGGTVKVWYLVGPYTLGYVAAGYLVVRSRPVLFRQRALTIGVVTLGFVAVVNLVAILLYSVRLLHGEPFGWTDGSVGRAIGIRLLVAIYSGVVAVPVGWGLVKSIPLWGFAATGPKR